MSRYLVVVVALAWANPAWAKVWHVTPSDKIQDAVTAAAAGDLILVDAGTFGECPVVSKAVRIAGAGAGATIIDCAASDTPSTIAITFKTFTTGFASLSGVTIANKGNTGVQVSGVDVRFGDVEFDGFKGTNGAALYGNNGKVLVHNCTFSNNTGKHGPAIYQNGGTLVVTASVFETNTATGWGGAIYAESLDLTLRSNNFDSNKADYGGAIYVTSTSTARTPAFSFDTFSNNTATTDGGAVYLDKLVSGTFSHVTFATNTAGDDGGGLAFATSASITDTAFDGNKATGNGGAVTWGASGTSYRTTYTSNTAAYGGAIEIPTSTSSTITATISASTFTSNSATTAGGAIYAPGPYLSLSTAGVQYDDNSAPDGGALYVQQLNDYLSTYENNAATDDGGAIAMPSSSSAYVYSSTFDSNTANDGGAVSVASGGYFYTEGGVFTSNTATAQGGAVDIITANAYFASGATIKDNKADNGGGVSIVDTAYNGYQVSFNNAFIDGNTATTAGGGVYDKYETVYGDYTWWTENSAGSGGGLWAQNPQNVYLYRSLVCGNAATVGPGGGLYLRNGYNGRIVANTAFVENTASTYGGASYEDGYTSSQYSYWYNSTWAGNTASSGYDNHVVTNSARAYIYDSVMYGDGDAVLTGTGTSTSSSFHYYYGSLFYNYGTYVYSNDNNWVSATYKNYAVDPKFVDYNATDCWDDDLRVGVTSYSGNYGYGVGVQAAYYVSPAPTADSDGDGYTPLEGDCDDSNSKRYRGAAQVTGNYVDEDCAGAHAQDDDSDGWIGSYYGGSDCNDRSASVYPGATDTWYDGTDSNCDGRDDYDQDGDGQRATKYAGADCDDTTPLVFTGAPEVWYDGVDQDCDGNDADADGDRYTYPTDCDDATPTTYPGAIDAPYDGIDANCDGWSDYDADRDGADDKRYGGDDCNDTNAAIYPAAAEIWYDGTDQNCDGADDCDQDGDGHRPDTKMGSCPVGDDCDDTNPATYEGAREVVDGLDNDCDGSVEKDTDLDGIIDNEEVDGGTDPNDADSDDDGMTDGAEWGPDQAPADTDGDGTVDALDTDSDADGVPDADEQADGVPYDTDGDGLADFRDPDDDGDGLPTSVEGGDDLDGDGAPNNRDLDADGDNIPDSAESGDNDGDGLVDALDNGGPAPYAPTWPESKGLGCAVPGGAVTPAGALLLLLGLIRRRR